MKGKGMRGASIEAILVALLFCASCTIGAHVTSEVTVFHQMLGKPNPTTYAFFPSKDQEISLEYKAYQTLIRQHLAENAFTEVSLDQKPNVIIAFLYGIEGTEKLITLPIIGQTGVSSSTTYGTLNSYGNTGSYTAVTTYSPKYGMVGTRTIRKTEYNRELRLFIVDSDSIGAEKIEILYDGNVKSSGRSHNLAEVMPAMIDALFKDFPGKNGGVRTEIIRIK